MSKVKFSVIEDNQSFKVLQTISAQGAKMNKHYSDQDAFLIILSGAVSFYLNEENIKLHKGDHLKIPALKLHYFEVSEDCNVILILNKNAKIQFVQDGD